MSLRAGHQGSGTQRVLDGPRPGKHGDPLDARLGAEDIAKGHLVRRVLEDSVY